MQYIIMFSLVVMASIADIITGILKAHITSSSTRHSSRCVNAYAGLLSNPCKRLQRKAL